MTPDPSKGLCIREVWSVFVGVSRLPQRGSILHIKHVQRIMDKKTHSAAMGWAMIYTLNLKRFKLVLTMMERNDGRKTIISRPCIVC